MELNNKNRVMLFPRINKIIIVVFAIAFILAGVRAYQLFNFIFKENVKSEGAILIPRNATFKQVTDSLQKHDILIDYKAFKWVANRKKYPENIKPGYYSFRKQTTTNQLVNMLISGNQQAVRLTFNNVRTFNQLAAIAARYIEPDSVSILNTLTAAGIEEKYGFSKATFPCMFIPNTYEIYWTTNPQEFIARMQTEYRRFWNADRLAKAASKNLKPEEICILASIVQEETVKADEKARVAGLYLNRIKRGIPLQADPTVKYALGDFSIRRVLTQHLKTDSPYNTYLHAGLPPGPINFPEISSIQAVLNAESHEYLYMCAKEDFSGYHNFSKTLAGHNQNARKYQQALNRNKIWK